MNKFIPGDKTQARRKFPLRFCVLATVSFLALVPVHAHAQSDVSNRIKRLENEIETLNRAVYKGEKPPVSASGASDSASANFDSRLNQLETDLRNLTGKVEQQAYDNQQLQQKLDALEQDSRMRLDAVEAQLRPGASAGTVPPSSSASAAASPPTADTLPQGELPPEDQAMPDTNKIPPPGMPDVLQSDPNAAASAVDNVTGAETGLTVNDAAGLYEQGFTEIKRQDYAAAEKSFSSFMKKYPTHALAPNALYWLGETYYVRKQYDKASRTFAEAYQKYPKGPKGADNLLKLGLSLAAKGEKDNACIALAQLKKEYPAGPEPVLKRGEDERKTLGCK
jgi:tol-pal system protein YbgF